MSLEVQLERIADALERLAFGGGGPTVETTDVEDAAVPPKPVATIDDVRDALREHARAHGRDSAIEVLGQLGVKSASALDPARFGEALDLLRKPKETAA